MATNIMTKIASAAFPFVDIPPSLPLDGSLELESPDDVGGGVTLPVVDPVPNYLR